MRKITRKTGSPGSRWALRHVKALHHAFAREEVGGVRDRRARLCDVIEEREVEQSSVHAWKGKDAAWYSLGGFSSS